MLWNNKLVPRRFIDDGKKNVFSRFWQNVPEISQNRPELIRVCSRHRHKCHKNYVMLKFGIVDS